MYFLLKCVLKQGKAEKVSAVVKRMDAKPQAYKQTEITAAFLGLSSVLSTAWLTHKYMYCILPQAFQGI